MFETYNTQKFASALALVALLGTLTACQDDDDSTSSVDNVEGCEAGEQVTLSDGEVCVFAQNLVIENGFDCPAGFDTLSTFGPIGICSAGSLAPEQLEETARMHRDRNPTQWPQGSCVARSECAAEQMCTDAECVNATAAACPDDLMQIADSSECLQDDAVCYELADGIWCTGPSAPTCPEGLMEIADSSGCLQDDAVCFQVSESLWCTGPSGNEFACADLEDEFNTEYDAISSCTMDSECGQVLTGTSCGCTRNLVARNDADDTRFYELQQQVSDADCALGGSTCDCPEADGFICNDGRCAWNYVNP